MVDSWNLTAAFDKPEYTPGEMILLTVSGEVKSGGAADSITITITASDGSVNSLPATLSVAGQLLTWGITGISDSSGRVWTLNGATASATA